MKGFEQGRFAERQIATFRWTVAKPVGNEQSEAIGALRRKIPFSVPKNKALLRKGFIFIQSEGLVCNPFARQTVCHQADRLVCFFSSDWLHTFLRNDYIPQQVADYIHGVAVITYIFLRKWFTFRLTTDWIQPDSMQHIKARNLTPFFFIQSE